MLNMLSTEISIESSPNNDTIRLVYHVFSDPDAIFLWDEFRILISSASVKGTLSSHGIFASACGRHTEGYGKVMF